MVAAEYALAPAGAAAALSTIAAVVAGPNTTTNTASGTSFVGADANACLCRHLQLYCVRWLVSAGTYTVDTTPSIVVTTVVVVDDDDGTAEATAVDPAAAFTGSTCTYAAAVVAWASILAAAVSGVLLIE